MDLALFDEGQDVFPPSAESVDRTGSDANRLVASDLFEEKAIVASALGPLAASPQVSAQLDDVCCRDTAVHKEVPHAPLIGDAPCVFLNLFGS